LIGRSWRWPAGSASLSEAAGLSFVLGTRIPDIPYVVKEWRRENPGEELPDGQVLTQPWPASTIERARGKRDRTIYYQYRADRARRSLRGIDEQIGKAESAVAGKAPVKRNRFIKLTGASKWVNRDLEAKTRALAGIKGYTTNIANPSPEFVIGAYAGLWRIDAHINIVFAALAITRLVEARTG
jgi:hypothetical protein